MNFCPVKLGKVCLDKNILNCSVDLGCIGIVYIHLNVLLVRTVFYHLHCKKNVNFFCLSFLILFDGLAGFGSGKNPEQQFCRFYWAWLQFYKLFGARDLKISASISLEKDGRITKAMAREGDIALRNRYFGNLKMVEYLNNLGRIMAILAVPFLWSNGVLFVRVLGKFRFRYEKKITISSHFL